MSMLHRLYRYGDDVITDLSIYEPVLKQIQNHHAQLVSQSDLQLQTLAGGLRLRAIKLS